jgi:hypothetical protein
MTSADTSTFLSADPVALEFEENCLASLGAQLGIEKGFEDKSPNVDTTNDWDPVKFSGVAQRVSMDRRDEDSFTTPCSYLRWRAKWIDLHDIIERDYTCRIH